MTTTATATRTLLQSLRDYSKHFNVTKVWQTLKNETSMNGAHLYSRAEVLPKTSNLVILRCCFADDDREIDENEKMHV